MRIIKFRGKRRDNGEWLYGYLYKYIDSYNKEHFCILDDEDKIIVNEYGSEIPAFIEVIPETIGQYTGLKDKNEKEIYEGDIVKILINGIWYIGKVIYEHSEFIIDVMNNKKLEFGRRGIIEIFTEVIGNTINNLELIK